MDTVNRRRRNILALAGLLPGVLLGTPKQLQAGKQKLKPFLNKLELENSIRLKPVRLLTATCNDEENGMSVFYMPGKQAPLFGLNRTGKIVWDACNGENTLKDIASLLSQKYEVTSKQACLDVFVALRDLRSKGAVRF